MISTLTVHVFILWQSHWHLSFCTTAPTLVIYSKEDSEDVLLLSDFLRKYCGIPCDIDQYNSQEKILDWGGWVEKKVTEYAHPSVDGFVLLVCSYRMYEQLSKHDKSSRIQMEPGHISSLALNSLIKDQQTTHCFIPVCLEDLQMENIPKSLSGRSCYSLSLSKLKKVNPQEEASIILSTPGLELLQSLVYRLRREPEVEKPPVAS